jgi:hypothetical protein
VVIEGFVHPKKNAAVAYSGVASRTRRGTCLAPFGTAAQLRGVAAGRAREVELSAKAELQ